VFKLDFGGGARIRQSFSSLKLLPLIKCDPYMSLYGDMAKMEIGSLVSASPFHKFIIWKPLEINCKPMNLIFITTQTLEAYS
jgi:hypothetical protein